MRECYVSPVTYAWQFESEPMAAVNTMAIVAMDGSVDGGQQTVEHYPLEVKIVARDALHRSPDLWIVVQVVLCVPEYCLLRVTKSGVMTVLQSPELVEVQEELRKHGRMIHHAVPPHELAALLSAHRAILRCAERVIDGGPDQILCL